jgi:hypothetical protein
MDDFDENSNVGVKFTASANRMIIFVAHTKMP